MCHLKRQPEATWSFIKSERRKQRLDYESRATEGHSEGKNERRERDRRTREKQKEEELETVYGSETVIERGRYDV